jgi:hypothetical protein
VLLCIEVALFRHLLSRFGGLYSYWAFDYGFRRSARIGFLILAIRDSGFDAVYGLIAGFTELSRKHFCQVVVLVGNSGPSCTAAAYRLRGRRERRLGGGLGGGGL